MMNAKMQSEIRGELLAVADAADVPGWARDELMRIVHKMMTYRTAAAVSVEYDEVGYEAGHVPERPR